VILSMLPLSIVLSIKVDTGEGGMARNGWFRVRSGDVDWFLLHTPGAKEESCLSLSITKQMIVFLWLASRSRWHSRAFASTNESQSQ
jgi:hypothetical protein